MSPTPIILAALASSCRVLSNSNCLKSAEKREVFELHLQWIHLVTSWGTENGCKDAKLEELALHMAQFVVNHEPRRPNNDYLPSISEFAAKIHTMSKSERLLRTPDS